MLKYMPHNNEGPFCITETGKSNEDKKDLGEGHTYIYKTIYCQPGGDSQLVFDNNVRASVSSSGLIQMFSNTLSKMSATVAFTFHHTHMF